MIANMEEGKKLDLAREDEPDVLFALCSEMFKTMTKESQNTIKECGDTIADLESILNLKAEAPERIERIVENLLDNVQRINSEKVSVSQMDEERAKDKLYIIEKDVLGMFDRKQRVVALKILNILNNQFKPPSKSKSTTTALTSVQVDQMISGPKSDSKALKTIKFAQDERLAMRHQVNDREHKIVALEEMIDDLISNVRGKDQEIFSLLRKYEQEKVSEDDIVRRLGMSDDLKSRATRLKEQVIKSDGSIDAGGKEKRDKFVKAIQKVLSHFLNYSEVIGVQNIPLSALDQMKTGFKDTVERYIKDEFGEIGNEGNVGSKGDDTKEVQRAVNKLGIDLEAMFQQQLLARGIKAQSFMNEKDGLAGGTSKIKTTIQQTSVK